MRKTIQNRVIALRQPGWSVQRIQEATGVRRETISKNLKRNSMAVRRPRGRPLTAEVKAFNDSDGMITDTMPRASPSASA